MSSDYIQQYHLHANQQQWAKHWPLGNATKLKFLWNVFSMTRFNISIFLMLLLVCFLVTYHWVTPAAHTFSWYHIIIPDSETGTRLPGALLCCSLIVIEWLKCCLFLFVFMLCNTTWWLWRLFWRFLCTGLILLLFAANYCQKTTSHGYEEVYVYDRGRLQSLWN